MIAEIILITRERLCSARLPNDILMVFSEPVGHVLRLGDRLRFDDLRIDAEVAVVNETQGRAFSVHVTAEDMYDLRLPVRHGGSRTPTPERLKAP
jgi:hypothetical protein